MDLRQMQGACGYCSTANSATFHSGACPKVKSIEYDRYGQIKHIEFFEQK